MTESTAMTEPTPAPGPPLAERAPGGTTSADPRGELLRLAEALRERRSAQTLHEFLRLRRALRC